MPIAHYTVPYHTYCLQSFTCTCYLYVRYFLHVLSIVPRPYLRSYILPYCHATIFHYIPVSFIHVRPILYFLRTIFLTVLHVSSIVPRPYPCSVYVLTVIPLYAIALSPFHTNCLQSFTYVTFYMYLS
jgi:hypothetical protein